MVKTSTKVLAGVAVAALAAAGVAAVVNHRRGQIPDRDTQDHLDELDDRLTAAESPVAEAPSGALARILDGLKRNQDISIGQLRRWITGVRSGTLSPEQAMVAESDFDALEKEAGQGGL